MSDLTNSINPNVDKIEPSEALLQARLKREWTVKPRKNVIGGGSRERFVVKLDLDGESLVLKMVDVFKHDPGAVDELENEYKVLRHLNENNFPYVPRVRTIMTISLFRTLVIDFIPGVKYDDFCEVSKDMREKCLDIVKEMHVYKVAHNDLEPSKFIFPTGCDRAILIDFSRASLNASQASLDDEYRRFSRSLCLPIETSQTHIQSDDDDYIN